MTGGFTLTIIKPDAVQGNHAGNILKLIIEKGFRIAAMKMFKMSEEQASSFYAVHKDRDFYKNLVVFMSSGPVIAAIIEKPDAVAEYRRLMGATDPSKAGAGTIRNIYSTSIQKNAVHGSDSDENAVIESNFFFAATDRF